MSFQLGLILRRLRGRFFAIMAANLCISLLVSLFFSNALTKGLHRCSCYFFPSLNGVADPRVAHAYIQKEMLPRSLSLRVSFGGDADV
ncbi:hypothetical protein F4805DRAFT_444062 [Annulohypoxylon moriforme]|nr:hypothetical protein F4805DRAFT_444062 [Annulohypoxylon moriforme]